MKCPRCGTESRIREDDKFCHKCGYPLKAVARDGESEELKSFFHDIDTGVLLINGKEINNVTAFSLNFTRGKNGLCVTLEDLYEAIAPLSIEKICFIESLCPVRGKRCSE